MQEVLTFATVLLPIVTALVQLAKKTAPIPKNYVPIGSLLLGVLIGFLATPFTDLDLVLRLWAGGFAGLSSTGAFELVNQRSGLTKEEK